MFDLGWSEMAIIFLIALIVIGPKDLPRVARTVGKWTGKARAMARDFQRSIDDMAREAELDEIKKTINKAATTDVNSAVKEIVDPKGEIDAATDMSDFNIRVGSDPNEAPPPDDDDGPSGKPVGKSAAASAAAAKPNASDKSNVIEKPAAPKAGNPSTSPTSTSQATTSKVASPSSGEGATG